MPTNISTAPPGAVPASPQRSGLPDFFAWLGACPWLFLAIVLPFSGSGKHPAYAIFALIALAVGYTILFPAALVTGTARKTLGASLAGVFVGVPLVVVGTYFFLLAE